MKRTLAALGVLLVAAALALGPAEAQGSFQVALPDIRHSQPEPLSLEPGECGSTTLTILNAGNESATLRFGVPDFVIMGQERSDVTGRVEPPVATLLPNQSMEVRVEACVYPSADEGVTNLTIDVGAVPGVPLGTIPIGIEVRGVGEATLPTAAYVAVAAAAGLGASWWLVRRIEWLRYLALAAAAPLYTRLARSTLLEQPHRDAIYRLVHDEPGIHFSALLSRTGLPNGVLVHHLRTLERHHLITSRRDGALRRFAASIAHMPAPGPKPITPMQSRVLDLLRDGPLSQADIARAMGLTQQGANRHVKALERRGLLEIRYAEGRWLCHAAPNNGASPIDV